MNKNIEIELRGPLSKEEFERRAIIYEELKRIKREFKTSTYCNEKIRVQRLNESDSEKSM